MPPVPIIPKRNLSAINPVLSELNSHRSLGLLGLPVLTTFGPAGQSAFDHIGRFFINSADRLWRGKCVNYWQSIGCDLRGGQLSVVSGQLDRGKGAFTGIGGSTVKYENFCPQKQFLYILLSYVG